MNDTTKNFISILVNSNQTTSDQIDLISRLVNTMADQGTIARDKDTVIEMVSQMLIKVANDNYSKGYKDGDQVGQCTGNSKAKSDIQRVADDHYNQGYESGYTDGHSIAFDHGYKLGWSDASNQVKPNPVDGSRIQDEAPF